MQPGIVLALLEHIGLSLKRQAERAREAEAALVAMREAYRKIRGGEQAGPILVGLRSIVKTPPERKMLENLIRQTGENKQ